MEMGMSLFSLPIKILLFPLWSGTESEIFFSVQSFNSINQNACMVAAYLLSTCNQGCKCALGRSTRGAIVVSIFSLFLSAFTINSLLPGSSYSGPSGVDNSNMCKCNTVAYSLISACDACQSSNWITYVSSSPFLLQSPSAYSMRLLLGGLSIRTIVQKLYLPRREFPVSATNYFDGIDEAMFSASLTLSPIGHVYPGGLFSMSQFVTTFSIIRCASY